MTQKETLDILKTGASVFLTGEPGAGKTHTVNEYVAYLRGCGIEPAVTASTGIAATHLRGTTLHSWSGLGVARGLAEADLAEIARSRHVFQRVRKTRVLIIDEVSMIDGETLSAVETICRKARRSEEPFGGLQVVLVGDFFQLPPVAKNGEEASFAFRSEAWRRLDPAVCYLTEQHRQEDAAFMETLSAIRRNEFGEEHFEAMRSSLVSFDEVPADTTRLFSHNVDVDSINAGELAKLPGKAKVFVMSERGADRLVEALKRGCLSPERLELKEGASVMFTKNNPSAGVVNGTLGTVVSFDETRKLPVVRTREGRLVPVEPTEWAIEEDGEELARIVQLPLRLAWAITIHKSQGMSLDAAVMDLSRVFEFGQGYVALSRVRRRSGVYLLGASQRAFLVSPDILEQDAAFREGSRRAQESYASLPTEEIAARHRRFVESCGGTWTVS
jgi:ATP-dependent DNA helicase PIF1